MPEPLTTEYLRETQRIVAAVPKGPWDIQHGEDGVPIAIGPICWLETYDGNKQAPVVEFIHHAREALAQYVGEVSRLGGENRLLRARIRQLEGGVRRGR